MVWVRYGTVRYVWVGRGGKKATRQLRSAVCTRQKGLQRSRTRRNGSTPFSSLFRVQTQIPRHRHRHRHRQTQNTEHRQLPEYQVHPPTYPHTHPHPHRLRLLSARTLPTFSFLQRHPRHEISPLGLARLAWRCLVPLLTHLDSVLSSASVSQHAYVHQ